MTVELIPGLEGIPIAESGVSFVDGKAGVLEYRGINIEELAEKSSFEEVSYLLMRGELPSTSELVSFQDELRSNSRLKFRIVELIKCLPENGHPMDALQAAIAAIGMFYPPRHNLTKEQRWEASMRLVAKTSTVVATFERLRRGDEQIAPKPELSLAGNFLYLLNGKEPDAIQERILDVCLILHADHTMNASTFAGRVVGSTLADPYCVVSSALGALSGPLHGGANEDAMALFSKIGSVKNAKTTVDRMIAEKEKIPGFGHRVYKTMDPRAKVLKKYAEELAGKSDNPHFEIALEVEKIAVAQYGEKGIWPNVDFYSGIVYTELGFATECFTPIFAVARVAGWLAHWLEQAENNRLFRPTQKYVGQHGQPYVPLGER